jgi:acyl-CoA thioesterase
MYSLVTYLTSVQRAHSPNLPDTACDPAICGTPHASEVVVLGRSSPRRRARVAHPSRGASSLGDTAVVGNLDQDTAVKGRDGRYRALLSPDWEIWGPNGGYVASVALRAAAAHTAFERPAAFSCHYLSVARFDEVDLEVRTLRQTKRAESVAVSMTQTGTPVLEALVWMIQGGDGLRHDHATMPDVAHHETLPEISELLPPDTPVVYPFWENFESKPLRWYPDPMERPAGEPVVRNWYRFVPEATFEDPVVDACRSLILLDTMSWPAATRAHPPDLAWMAPNLDVAIQFHRSDPGAEWLLADAVAPVAHDGLIGFRSQVWTDGGTLLASGSGQLLCRPLKR